MNELALPRATARLLDEIRLRDRHPGLQLDKFSTAGTQKEQGRQLDDAVRCAGDKELLAELRARRDGVLSALDATRLRACAAGPATLHLSRSGTLENAGIALHPVYGFAWLPGTGLKGMTRAWAETVWAAGETDKTAAWRDIRAAFGTASGSERGKAWIPDDAKAFDNPKAGRIVFHDAWPVSWPRLERDIANIHHPKYYRGEGPPGDWEDPSIISFLAIAAGTEFDFALSDRAPAGDGLCDRAMEWLRAALAYAGPGAKTAAGYGRFVPAEGAPPAPRSHLVRAEYTLELVSPAFLAGALQKEADCDLRPATLRGLLRWWWRTMHAGSLSCDRLAELETRVWGAADSGSPVSIALTRERATAPQLYNYKDKGVRPKQVFAKEHELQPPGGGKTIQGLFYASYGMDESGSDKRWFRQAGDRWRLTLAARDGLRAEKHGRIPARIVMEQAEAALWLLTRFGGAGSRSRKGFGSFAEISGLPTLSLDACKTAGRKLRQTCGMDPDGNSDTPSLETALVLETKTPWKDCWFTLDQVGSVYQGFAKSLKGDDDRMALGLPRKAGAKDRERKLEDKMEFDRHASPAIWSLSRQGNGAYTVRLVAFPAARLPNGEVSERVLRGLYAYAKEKLGRRVDSFAKLGQGGRRSAASSAHPADSVNLPKVGDTVDAVLLKEKTRKGKWKARIVGDGMEGDIMDSDKVPSDVKPGDRVRLTVRVAKSRNGSFMWFAAR